jgi:PAS domain S-box-containing protein
MELDFKTLYNHAPCGYLFTREDGTLIDVNDTFLAFTGYSREEIIENKRFEDFLSIGGKIYHETHFAPLLHMQGEVSQINFDFIRKDETRFPVLINAIKQSIHENQHNYIQFIVVDITQRKQYEMELMNAKRKSEELLTQLSKVNKELTNNIQVIAEQSQQLEKLNATKDKFFGIVAHDLRSPLSSLKMFLSLLVDSLNKEDILTISRQLSDSVDSTIKMADNLITWASIQMGDSQFNEETIKVKDITSNIFDVYQNVALEKGINISFSVDDSLTIIGDKNQIEFVIRNLVNNAIKFTHKNGFVSLTAKSLPDRLVEISVSDSGVGISDEYKRELFSISKKQSTDGTAGEKGTGLGLMLSYEFMKLNGGQIEIESSLGKGTTFHTKFKCGHKRNDYIECNNR